MAIKPPDYQLKLQLDLPEEQVSNVLSEEQIRLRAAAAQAALESGDSWQKDALGHKIAPPWLEQYVYLLAGGWDWKVAVYIAWKAAPKGHRWPKTQEELAVKVLGLTSDRQISVWRSKNPAIDAMARDVAAGMVFDAVGDIFAAMIAVGSTPDYKGKGDRELLFKIVGMLSDGEVTLKAGGDSPDDILKKMPFEELMRGAGINTPAKIAALRDRLAAELANPPAVATQPPATTEVSSAE